MLTSLNEQLGYYWNFFNDELVKEVIITMTINLNNRRIYVAYLLSITSYLRLLVW